ncbi:nitrate- and nitrite sensing domain-containing protein [Streptomyces sp. NPDC048718]|uniref:nitrate- and nitrite sensing domain-containing protein n=1 Tax=Streptomyces sp. NPDC048718 TaxID=3365587 RepID=UPI00371EDB07
MRTALLVLAFVPGIALTALWAVASGQTFFDFQRMAAQGQLAEKAGQPSNIVYYNLQRERRLSADVLAGRSEAATALTGQREETDKAVKTFLTLSDDPAVDNASDEVRDAVNTAREAIGRLSVQRALVDDGDAGQQETVYRYYTDLIAVDLKLFTALSHVDDGKVTTASQPLVELFWTKEMISRSDALLARGWGRDGLSVKDFQQVQQGILTQSFQADSKVTPYLPEDELAMWREMTASQAWRDKTAVEQSLLRPAEPDENGRIAIGDQHKKWRASIDGVTTPYEKLLEHRTQRVIDQGLDSVLSLLIRLVLTTVVGLAAVLAVIWTTWRLTRGLRLRIGRLQEQAEALEKSLPEVVERLARGEQIDVEAEARAIEQDTDDGRTDELAQLGKALNLARTSALQAAVSQADQHRGFERLLQRVARRTQQLIGQQLKKLDEMERRHEDAEVLDGLFDLDHLTARLRRYEENLVILSGGTPHRRWRKPVALLDVMRSAQGEVQDYRRVVLDLDGSPWLASRAVGPVAHILAELIENALSFSRPPNPVEVRAAVVSRGLAIEVEDRGLGMEEEQMAEANALMLHPPRLDILAHAEDIRLGLHVVARLTHQYGLSVEFRPSAYGGTRVVLLVPGDLIVSAPQQTGPVAVPDIEPAPAPLPAPAGAHDPLPSRRQGQALAAVTRLSPQVRPASQHPEPEYGEQEYAGREYAGQPEPEYAGHAGHLGHSKSDYPGHAETEYPGHHPYAAPETAGMPETPVGARHTEGHPSYEPVPAAPYETSLEEQGPYGEPHPVADPFVPGPPAAPEAGFPSAAPAYGSTRPYGTADAYPVPHEQPDGTGQAVSDGHFGGGHGPVHETSHGSGHESDLGHGRPDAHGTGHGHGHGHSDTGAFDGFGAPEHGGQPAAPAEQGGFTARYVTPLPSHAGHTPAPGAPPAAPAAAPESPSPAPASAPANGGEAPLPRRVRQASLVDELRLDPTSSPGTPQPPRWQDDPMLRPAPRRAGATIGAFQRRSRAARAAEPDAPAGPGASHHPTREEDGS